MNEYVPPEFYLGQNYPNPFKEKTTIKYCVPHKTRVRITIYNSQGKMIEKLVDEIKSAGTYEVEIVLPLDENSLFDTTYFYNLETDNYSNLKKMVLIK